MDLTKPGLDLDEGLAILTEMIVREIGPPSALANREARAAAVARVERLLDNLADETPSRVFHGRQDGQWTGARIRNAAGDRALARRALRG